MKSEDREEYNELLAHNAKTLRDQQYYRRLETQEKRIHFLSNLLRGLDALNQSSNLNKSCFLQWSHSLRKPPQEHGAAFSIICAYTNQETSISEGTQFYATNDDSFTVNAVEMGHWFILANENLDAQERLDVLVDMLEQHLHEYYEKTWRHCLGSVKAPVFAGEQQGEVVVVTDTSTVVESVAQEKESVALATPIECSRSKTDTKQKEATPIECSRSETDTKQKKRVESRYVYADQECAAVILVVEPENGVSNAEKRVAMCVLHVGTEHATKKWIEEHESEWMPLEVTCVAMRVLAHPTRFLCGAVTEEEKEKNAQVPIIWNDAQKGKLMQSLLKK